MIGDPLSEGAVVIGINDIDVLFCFGLRALEEKKRSNNSFMKEVFKYRERVGFLPGVKVVITYIPKVGKPYFLLPHSVACL